MRSRVFGAFVGLVAAVAAPFPSGPAAAHEPRRFEACTVQLPGTCMDRGASFLYGDTVVVRGRVEPPHAGRVARVLRRDPGSDVWRRAGTVTVSDRGRMRFVWHTTRADAVQNAPYLFRFRIPGHGASDRTEAYVLFGE